MEKGISSDLIRGHIDTIILYSLLNGEKHTQQIIEDVEQKSDKQYELNQATLYSSLKRLENLKQVVARWRDSDNGRRKFFFLTDAGRKTVENNLSNWTFSRAILDKLMDTSSSSTEKEVVEVEKIVEKTVYVDKPVYVDKTVYVDKPVYVEKLVEKPVYIDRVINSNDIATQKNVQLQEEKPIEKVENDPKNSTNMQEINFRTILKGLIQANNTEKLKPIESNLEPIIEEKEEIIDEIVEIPTFSETIDKKVSNAKSSNNHIDFGDLQIKAEKEGYKIKISNKETKSVEGSIYAYKLNLWVSLALFLLCISEFLYFSLSYKELLSIDVVKTFVVIAILLVYPMVSVVLYLRNKNKLVNKKVKVDLIITFAIIVFNLLLITFAINLLANVDLSDKFSFLCYFAIPAAVIIDLLFYAVIKFFLAKMNCFHYKSEN